MGTIRRILKKILPKWLLNTLLPFYHYFLSWFGALWYGHPTDKVTVIGVTGTKGKSSITEIVNAILEEAGHKTAVINTIRFKTGDTSEPNLFKMSMPGRMFIQRFISDAHKAGCTHVVLEMTSEGTKQFRHKHIELDALIFSNISPEHIESHGSFKKYLAAKLKIRDTLSTSKKLDRVVIANVDDKHGYEFLEADVPNKVPFGLEDVVINSTYPSISFTYNDTVITSPLQGEFNVYNILASVKLAQHLGINMDVIARALKNFSDIPGRVQYIDAGQSFKVVVDYAHTSDSLKALYKNFEGVHKVCVLGNCGGGRDRWKRPEMAKVAEQHCDYVILTNEDPYDEDPDAIVAEMVAGMEKKPNIIMDRREAIAHALKKVHKDGVVLITGKGTDPYIMESNGKKTPWSDANVARDEIKKFLSRK